ncbi:MAG: hypothetical protein LC779_03840 [Actinobacteria bacterium]|nr:hypothetical protein [Actinomycetota bacterium]
MEQAAKDAAGVSAPTVAARDLAITPVMHTGNVCNNGTVCGITDDGDRTLLDFFQVAIDGQGRANIAYAADQGSAGTAHIEYVRQNSGLSLIDGSPVQANVFPDAGGTVCTPDGTVVDPAGDATGAALVDDTPTPSQNDLDVVRAFLTTGGTAAAPSITTHVKVKDLTTTGGQYFRFYFSYGTGEYLTTASRSVAGSTAYDLKANGTTGATELKPITGTFDPVKDEITTTFSAADFNSTAKPKDPLATGSSLGGLQVLAQRSAGVGATLTSDTATGLCPYLVGTAPAAAAAPTAAASSAPASPSGSAGPSGCPSTTPKVRINGATTINATGRASVTVTGAAPSSTVELQGYSQNHKGTATFDNDPTPVDRTGKADSNGSITFNDLMPASNTRLRARQQGCPNGDSVVLEVRAQETLVVTRTGTRAYTFSGKSIPAREGGLIVTLYRIVGQPCAAGVDPSRCPGETLLRQARADAQTGEYAMSVSFGARDQGVRDEFVVKTGRDAQNAPGRSNTRSLLIS